MIEEAAILNVPIVKSPPGKKNLVRSVVCELRLPALLELEIQRPVSFQKAIRKEYPVYEERRNVSLGPVGTEHALLHTFMDRNKKWIVTFKPTALSLETTNYESYEHFKKKLTFIISASRETRDSDFFTRVGLRYINEFPADQTYLNGWMNSDLIQPLVGGVFRKVDQFWQVVRGTSRSGKYILQHGLAGIQAEGVTSPSKVNYVLDIDFCSEDIEETRVSALLDSLHEESFSLFYWAIGEAARKYMWPSGEDKNGC